MMPFRIPHNYASLTTCQGDPDQGQTELYLTWLHQEVKTAEAYYAANWGTPKAEGKSADDAITSCSSYLVRRAIRSWNRENPDARVEIFADLKNIAADNLACERGVGKTSLEAIQSELAVRGIRWVI